MKEYVVQGIQFSEAGVDLQYMVLPDDVRSEGRVVASRQIAIAYTSPAGLGDAATDLRTAVEALAKLAASSFEQLAPYEPPKSEVPYLPRRADDDDDVGMGDGR